MLSRKSEGRHERLVSKGSLRDRGTSGCSIDVDFHNEVDDGSGGDDDGNVGDYEGDNVNVMVVVVTMVMLKMRMVIVMVMVIKNMVIFTIVNVMVVVLMVVVLMVVVIMTMTIKMTTTTKTVVVVVVVIKVMMEIKSWKAGKVARRGLERKWIHKEITNISKIKLVGYHQWRVLIGWATSRLSSDSLRVRVNQ